MIRPRNLQEKIFEYIREHGLSVREKCQIVFVLSGKRQVCHLTRPQGEMLLAYLKYCMERGDKPTPEGMKKYDEADEDIIVG